jgi:rare lipoprotein A (peptidoglycan hydrolase)/tetratricopeptide (TPR) repeat protein
LVSLSKRGELQPAGKPWPVRVRRPAGGASVSLLAAYAAALSLAPGANAKTPGEVHCYNGICHRVKTVDEMRLMVGSETEAVTSFYDIPERDRMNVGTITSSGEEFDADSDQHAASSLYPDGTELLVWNPKNGRAAHIRINDFGPFYLLRTIDVTRRVAEKLDFAKTGVARLRVIIIWAPQPEDARFSKRRVYPKVEGYLGRLDFDQLASLKNRLIATAPTRNGRPQVAVAANGPQPSASLQSLPAFARADASNALARRKADILNTPRIQVFANGSARLILPTGQIASLRPVGIIHASLSARAVAAATLPPAAVVTARDAGVAEAVVGLALETPTSQTQSLASAAPLNPERVVVAENTFTRPLFDAAANRAWAPSPLAWQQLLMALGLLSLAAAGWRTRVAFAGNSTSRTARQTARVRALQPNHKSANEPWPNVAEPQITAPVITDNIVALPQLPRRPAPARSMDDLRDAALAHMGRYELGLAEAEYRQLLSAREDAFGLTDPRTASAECQLADCLRDQGRYARAERHYLRALATMSAAVGDLHPATADILDEYALSLLKQGRAKDAQSQARQALAVRRHCAPQATRETAVSLSIVAETLRAQGQLMAADMEHRTAWSQFIAISGQDSLDAAASMTTLGVIQGELGHFAAAEELLNAGTRIIASAFGADHPATATGYALLSDLYRRAGALDVAAKMQRQALDIRERILGVRHPDTAESLLALALITTEQFRLEEARTVLDRALDALMASDRSQLGPQSRIRGLLVALSHHHETAPPIAMAAE